MALQRYPSELEGSLELDDGSSVAVRPIRPEDAALETRFVDCLSAKSRYQRFLNQTAHLTPQLLDRFTHPDYGREMALVALAPGNGEFIGVGRYAANAEGGGAEFALAVADAWQGRGLGHALLEKLIACAHAAGYAALDGTVLSANSDMLELVAALGFVKTGRDGDTVTVVRQL